MIAIILDGRNTLTFPAIYNGYKRFDKVEYLSTYSYFYTNVLIRQVF